MRACRDESDRGQPGGECRIHVAVRAASASATSAQAVVDSALDTVVDVAIEVGVDVKSRSALSIASIT
jgi:hypothetical protein